MGPFFPFVENQRFNTKKPPYTFDCVIEAILNVDVEIHIHTTRDLRSWSHVLKMNCLSLDM